MIETVSFKTRARTVDHLGREQIADAPTAVSELWKNSYDAYARNVTLHVFDGSLPVAAVVDDGHGMTKQEFIDRWLVVGTDAKLSGAPTPPADMFGLKIRAKQGQKGIGRLSCAALGRLALILSKKLDEPFVGALIDWRLFENPFLLLDDISLPVVTFEKPSELIELLPKMRDQLVGNLWGDGDSARTQRLTDSWERFSALEQVAGRRTTNGAIEAVIVADLFTERHFSEWKPWGNRECHGTAIFMVDLNFDLESLIAARDGHAADTAAKIASQRMRETLSSFIDPFNRPSEVVDINGSKADQEDDEFHYGIHVWVADNDHEFLSDDREFDYSNFEMLEHIVDGHIDSLGVFRGRVKAFGTWRDGEVTIHPDTVRIPKRPDARVGSFRFKVGAYEGVRNNSSLTDEQYAFVKDQAETFSGLFVFRDNLRVQPFGRPEYDFFEIERRRTEQAGREFWSHRRMFGSIDISSLSNPNLRDKAGREGLLDNQAAKVFREIVENVLMTSARQFFGYDSEERKPKILEIKTVNKARKAEEEQKKLAEKRRNEFRTRVRKNAGPTDALLKELRSLSPDFASINDAASALALRDKLMVMEERLHSLYVGDPPHSLQSFKQEFSAFESAYKAAALLLEKLTAGAADQISKFSEIPAAETLRSEILKRSANLAQVSSGYAVRAEALLGEASERLKFSTTSRLEEFERQAHSVVFEVEAGRLALIPAMARIDEQFHEVRGDLENLLQNLVTTFEALRDNIDLTAAAGASMDASAELREQLTRINALAQLGITVEIIGHELEALDATITRGLKLLPAEWHSYRAYQSVKSSHEALTERLRFLSPLKLSGPQAKERIYGHEIFSALQEFFGQSLKQEGVKLKATDEFYQFKIFDRKSRIVPVFFNLANNSRYWLGQSDREEKEILLDVRDGKVIFADNGPGVDEDDVRHLFTLFFSRRPRGGRGVGLYLCKSNLAAGGHEIWYAREESERALAGANFVLKFLSGAE